MKSLTVIAPDRLGLLLEITEALGKEKINIDSISLEVVGKKAVTRLIVDAAHYKAAQQVLSRKGFHVMQGDTLVIKLTDKPGELSKVAKMLSDAGIAVENVQIMDKTQGNTLCALRVDKVEKAEKLLKEYM